MGGSGERRNGTYRSVRRRRSPNGHSISRFAGKIAGMTTKSETKTATRADLHCHSTASAVSKLGVQRALGLPECATPPEEVYALAKRRGMDFVTITDHDTIDGALEIADRPDVFVSEELTARFAGEPQAVHILCFGITPGDHEWLQAHAGDVEQVAEYLREQEIASALAHPFYAVEAPLTARHRRRLAELFGVWEVRNGARAPELNAPAAVYVDTHGGTGVGGSDDHAGVDIGRTWTEAPAASTPARVPRPPARRPRRRPRQAGLGRQVGARRDGDRPAHLRPQRGRAARPRGRAADDRAGHVGGRRPQRRARRRHRARRLPRAAARVARGDRPRPAAARAARADAGRRLQPHRAVPPRPPLPRAQAPGRGRPGAGDRVRGRRRRLGRGRHGGLRGVHPRGAVRARDRLPRPGEAQARRLRRRPAARRARRRRHRRHPRRHPHARGAAGARRSGLRGRRHRHRRPRRPAAPVGDRGRHAVRGRRHGRRARAAGRRRGALRRPLRPRAPVLARPGRHRRHAHRAAAGAADRRLVPHRARRLRAGALG